MGEREEKEGGEINEADRRRKEIHRRDGKGRNDREVGKKNTVKEEKREAVKITTILSLAK